MKAADSRLRSSLSVLGDVEKSAVTVCWTNSWVSVATGEGLWWDYAGTCRRQSNSTPNQKKKHGRAAEQRSAVPCGKSEQRSDPQPLALLVWNVPCRIAYVCSIPPTCQMGLSVCDPLAQAMERCRCLSKHAGLTKLKALKPCRVDRSPGCIQAWKSGSIVRLTRATPLGFCWYSVGSNVTAGRTLEPFGLSPEFRSSWWRLQTRDSVPAWVC